MHLEISLSCTVANTSNRLRPPCRPPFLPTNPMSQSPSAATSSANFETIFTAALEAYKKQTKKDITSHPLATQLQSCESPKAILAVLQAQIQEFDRSRNTNEKLTSWLDPTVNVLFAFSATLNSAAGLIFPPSSAIFTGIGVLLQAIKDVRASQEALVELFGRMEFFFKRLENYLEVRPTAAMTDIIVKIMVEVLSILGIVTKEIEQGRIKKYLKKLVGRKDVEDALGRLDKLTQEEARMAAVETLKIARGIDDKVVGVDDKVKGVDRKVGSVMEGVRQTGVTVEQVANQVSNLNRSELRKDLRKWISPPDPSVNYNTACKAHHTDTATWCTQGDTFADWKESGCLMWIHGIPGSGKSILSSVIIRDIKSISNAGSIYLAYFYFDFKDKEKQDYRALLSSLLVQLCNRSEKFCDILFDLYTKNQEGLEQASDDSLARCLKDMLTTAIPVPVYLVIDALDECPNDSGVPSSREIVLELVKELVELRHPNLRLCVLSRPEFDIRTVLEPLATQQISLQEESGQKQDIIDYITSVVRSDQKMIRWRDDDKDAVIEKLTQKADGMFRWVFCQLEVLRHCFPTNLRLILEELPKSLDETYERILKGINYANQEHAYRLLQCLTIASRPLRIGELAEVLAVDFSPGGIPKLKKDWRWEDQEAAVLSACSSLVSVITDNGHRIVQFSHFSVKEYLTSDRLASSTNEVSRFHIPIEPSHAILAQACLGVLLCLDDGTDGDDVKKKIPLVQYAAEYWVEHAQVGNVELRMKDALDQFFDLDKPHFSAWVQIQGQYHLKTTDEGPRAVPLSAAPLYVAAESGLRGLAERLVIKDPQQVNERGGSQGTPLHASVEEGHIEVVQLLLAHGADINTSYNMTPLHMASQNGHLEIGRWLLNHGADVYRERDGGWTPLHLAVANGHLEVSRMLLEHNATVDVWTVDGITPLQYVARSGELDLVRLLLNHGADVHQHDDSRNTPLHLAVAYGHLEVSRMLLERGAKPDVWNDGGTTPLLAASMEGYSEVVQLLLDHDAQVQVHDNSGNTPLHRAAARGRVETARILLERRVEVNSKDDGGCTPLHVASREGHSDVVQLLLDHGAHVHEPANLGNTPLHQAAIYGHAEVARILLERDAQVNTRNKSGSTSLHAASIGGYSDVVRLLLAYDARVRVHDNNGNSPLHYANESGHVEVARILLERDAEVNSRDDHNSALALSEHGDPNPPSFALGLS